MSPKFLPLPLRMAIGLWMLLFILSGCVSMTPDDVPLLPPAAPYEPPAVTRSQDYILPLETTAYCPCQKCCGWRYNWRGQPVFATGPNAGKPKAIGITASGLRARRGTLAADARLFPMGTVMYVPGYGWGRVEDRGSAIAGRKLDLFMPTHAEALRWGRRKIQVRVWLPQGTPRPISSRQKNSFP